MAEVGVREGQKPSLICKEVCGLRGAGCQQPHPVKAWNLHGNRRGKSAAKKNKASPRPPAWAAAGVDKGHTYLGDSVRFLCACTQRTHLLGGRDFLRSLPSASCPRPKPCAAGQGEKWHVCQAGH